MNVPTMILLLGRRLCNRHIRRLTTTTPIGDSHVCPYAISKRGTSYLTHHIHNASVEVPPSQSYFRSLHTTSSLFLSDNTTNNITTEYDFGLQQQQEESELKEWHTIKQTEYNELSSYITTNTTNNDQQFDIETTLSLMEQFNVLSSSITTELYALSDFRRNHTQYPPSRFMTDITVGCATHVDNLLAHLLNLGGELTPEKEVKAYKLALQSWSTVYHPTSGDKAVSILDTYGLKYGGDMNYMPSIDSHKLVLKAHLNSCSSKGTHVNYMNNFVGGSMREHESPGEKAWGILKLLKSVYESGDMFLKPDIELYSITIAVIRNTLLDWQLRRRFDGTGESRLLEETLANGALDALTELEITFNDEIMYIEDEKGSTGIDSSLSLHQWYCMIRAYSDALAISGKIPIKDAHDINGKLLKTMRKFITSNSSNIAMSVNNENASSEEVQILLESIQRNIEDSYTSALSSGLKNGSFSDFKSAIENATSADEIFQQMLKKSQESSSPHQFLHPMPTPANYRALIQCWTECVRKKYSTEQSNHAMANLDTHDLMKKNNVDEWPHLKAASYVKQLEMQMAAQPIDGAVYADIIWAWGQVLNWPSIYRVQTDYFFAANASDRILKHVMSQYENGSVYFYHNEDVTRMYNHVFRLLSKVHKGGESAVRRSLNLLDNMEHWYKQSDGKIAVPDDNTFGLILKTISNSGVESSTTNAANVIGKMNSFGLEPDERHYLGLIRAYARTGQRVVADPSKAEAVLRHVRERYKVNKSVKPNTAIYTACIAAYGGSRQHESISKVLELFDELNKLYKETNDKDFKPDSQLYGVVIDAISKNTYDNNSLRTALKLLEKMEKGHEFGEIDEGPNRYAYTNLLRAISESNLPDAMSISEDLLHRMEYQSRQTNDESIRPDTHAYTTLIQSLSKSKHPDAVQRAEKWFKQMEQRYEDGDTTCKPNKVTCTALINCWRYSGHSTAGEEATNLLSMMEERAENGDMDLKPDAFVYASVIDAWARSKTSNKAEAAWEVYERMKEQYMKGNMDAKPNIVIVSTTREYEVSLYHLVIRDLTYSFFKMTSIIKACGYTKGGRDDKQRALRILLECMSELKSGQIIKPAESRITKRYNSNVWAAILNAAHALVADDSRRRPISATIFETCCRNGQFDSSVLEALEKVQPELYRKLPADIPTKWRRNVSN